MEGRRDCRDRSTTLNLPQTHQAFNIAQVNPPPPLHDEAFWCDQVRGMLIGPLNRNVVEIQPTLFGVEMFQMRGPNAVNVLVQHGPYPLPPLHLNRVVCFIHVDDAVNHRATQGFRNVWLMLLGILPDYRNGLHIANAVSAFSKFHSWNSMDPIESRALVFASFQSPVHVPSDVVFGKFATVGGVRETWIVPVYIMTAEFLMLYQEMKIRCRLMEIPIPFQEIFSSITISLLCPNSLK
jgi:hypothetical protein